MTTLPLVIRELRAEARRPLHYWLRVGAVFLMMLFGTIAAWENLSNPALMGAQIFQFCAPILVLSCWLVLPAVASDCISVERREGTLGLLFLTPLRPLDILAGKIALQAVRVATIVTATLPVLAIGFLLGGVSRNEALVALVVLVGSLALLVSVTLLASTVSKQLHRALLAGYGLAGATFGGLYAAIVHVANRDRPSKMGDGWILLATFVVLAVSLSTLYLGLALFFLKRARRDEPRSPAAERWDRRLGLPVLFRAWFWRRQTRLLDRNPIAWLQQRGTGGRATKWGMCLGLVVLETFTLMYGLDDARVLQPFLGGTLLLVLSAAAVLTFAQERQSGALELLLVTTLRPAQILWGRLLGLWLNFLPAAAFLALCWWSLEDVLPWNSGPTLNVALAQGAAFLAVPVIGYAITLRVPRFGVAWVFTIALGLAIPLLLGWLASNWEAIAYGLTPNRRRFVAEEYVVWSAILWLALSGLAAGVGTLHSLRHRRFATRFA